MQSQTMASVFFDVEVIGEMGCTFFSQIHMLWLNMLKCGWAEMI